MPLVVAASPLIITPQVPFDAVRFVYIYILLLISLCSHQRPVVAYLLVSVVHYILPERRRRGFFRRQLLKYRQVLRKKKETKRRTRSLCVRRITFAAIALTRIRILNILRDSQKSTRDTITVNYYYYNIIPNTKRFADILSLANRLFKPDSQIFQTVLPKVS